MTLYSDDCPALVCLAQAARLVGLSRATFSATVKEDRVLAACARPIRGARRVRWSTEALRAWIGAPKAADPKPSRIDAILAEHGADPVVNRRTA